MYRSAFPKCTVDGDRSPEEYIGMLSEKEAIPKKCSGCENFFEGVCMRNLDQIEGYSSLDYGPCGIEGDSSPVAMRTTLSGYDILVPGKCASCEFLNWDSIGGYKCKEDPEIWGYSGRALDWGNWEPTHPIIGIHRMEKRGQSNYSLGSALVNEKLVKLIALNERTKAIKLYRELNGIETLKEAMTDVDRLIQKYKAVVK